MRKGLVLVWFCCACAPGARFDRRSSQLRMPMLAVIDTLTPVERARITEAMVRLRRMIFVDDTATQLEGCSVAAAIGADYRTLLTPDVRKLVSEPPLVCDPRPAPTTLSRRLIVGSIHGGPGVALIRVTYEGGRTYTHEEEFKVQKASSRPDGRWVAIEMRVYDALIAD
jgi:hypothetical protein